MYMEDYISEINGIHVKATPMTRGDYIKYSGSSDILSGIKSLLGSDDEDGYLIIYKDGSNDTRWCNKEQFKNMFRKKEEN